MRCAAIGHELRTHTLTDSHTHTDTHTHTRSQRCTHVALLYLDTDASAAWSRDLLKWRSDWCTASSCRMPHATCRIHWTRDPAAARRPSHFAVTRSTRRMDASAVQFSNWKLTKKNSLKIFNFSKIFFNWNLNLNSNSSRVECRQFGSRVLRYSRFDVVSSHLGRQRWQLRHLNASATFATATTTTTVRRIECIIQSIVQFVSAKLAVNAIGP